MLRSNLDVNGNSAFSFVSGIRGAANASVSEFPSRETRGMEIPVEEYAMNRGACLLHAEPGSHCSVKEAVN